MDVTALSASLPELLESFFDYVMEDICNCTSKECDIKNADMKDRAPKFYKKYLSKKSVTRSKLACNTVRTVGITTRKYRKMSRVQTMEQLFVELEAYNLITKSNGKMYLLDGHRSISWKNIKKIDVKYVEAYRKQNPGYCEDIYRFFNGEISKTTDEKTVIHLAATYIKYIFWYFRKVCVDSITSDIIKITNVIAISVGSTKIDSDYDITLYGRYNDIYSTIFEFNKQIESYFHTSPDRLFDTNMYGVSFIVSGHSPTNRNDTHFCGDKVFNISRNTSDPVSAVTQNIWSIIKLVSKLESIGGQEELLYDMLRNTLLGRSDNYDLILQTGERFVNAYDPSPSNYDAIVKDLEYQNTEDERSMINYISFVNYNGSETYFTRGAFLDVVVNGQMCMDETEKVELTQSEYFDSFVENMADFITHYYKDKYLIRAINAFVKLGLNTSVTLYKLMNIVDLQVNCKQAETLLKCSKFLIINECIKIVRNVSEMFLGNIEGEVMKRGIEQFKSMSVDFPTSQTFASIRQPGYQR